MIQPSRPPDRRALTLVELVASLVGAGALTAGMASTLFIAIRASNPAYTLAAGTLETTSCLADMSAELQFALSMTEKTTTAVTVTVPDRGDADVLPDTIRYAWAGTVGAPLTRQYNGGAAAIVMPSVRSMLLEYFPSSAAPRCLNIRLQKTSSANSSNQTQVPLLNMP